MLFERRFVIPITMTSPSTNEPDVMLQSTSTVVLEYDLFPRNNIFTYEDRHIFGNWSIRTDYSAVGVVSGNGAYKIPTCKNQRETKILT